MRSERPVYIHTNKGVEKLDFLGVLSALPRLLVVAPAGEEEGSVALGEEEGFMAGGKEEGLMA